MLNIEEMKCIRLTYLHAFSKTFGALLLGSALVLVMLSSYLVVTYEKVIREYKVIHHAI